MSRHYIYKMEIAENDTYHGVYIGQHKIGKKNPECDGYRGSGIQWKKHILSNHIPVTKTILRLCDNIEEANYWEQFYIGQAIQSGEYLWNVSKGGGAHEWDRIYTEEEIKAHNKERFNRWYESNKEHHKEHGRQYREHNKERVDLVKKRYKEEHKDFYVEYHKQYYENNKEKLSAVNKQYYEQHKNHLLECMKEYQKEYRVTHAEQLSSKNKRYYEEHKEERKKYYSQPCYYNGKMLSFGAVILRLRRQHISNPTQVAKQYLIKENYYETEHY